MHGWVAVSVLDSDDLQAMFVLVGKGWAESGRRNGDAIFKLTKTGKAKAKQLTDKARKAVKAAAR
jgi:predicted transcriptional regulator with HTH domain